MALTWNGYWYGNRVSIGTGVGCWLDMQYNWLGKNFG